MSHFFGTTIKAMHRKFGIDYNGPPRRLDSEEKNFRHTCMLEELREYMEADSMVDELDALADLLVFLLGTFERHGYPSVGAFVHVMNANMSKELAGKAENSKRSFAIDLVKPEGWVGPEQQLSDLLDYWRRYHDKFTDGAY